MELYFLVENQNIQRTDDNFVVAGSKNYLFANFTFSKEWNENIIAIFSSQCGTYAQPVNDGRCPVPYEVLKKSGRIDVSVCAGDLITSDTTSVIVHETGYTDKAEECITPPPTIIADIYNRIETGFAQAKEEIMTEIKEILGSYIQSSDIDSDLIKDSKNPVASGVVYNRLQSEIDRRIYLENKKADKEYNGGFVGGNGAALGGVGGAAVGANAKASSGMAGG